MLPVEVLKFGSSVLASPDDLPLAVDEIYRRLRQGRRVLAVVSAFAGETDRLFASVPRVLGSNAAPEAVAAHVATGELESAALLAEALRRAGVAARTVHPRKIGFRVVGDALEADPEAVHVDTLWALWDTYTTLVLPGFFGVDSLGRTALLGRGGSDLSAVFLARALGARCRLIKDVPGVFDRDPAEDRAHARRYTVIPWHEAARVAGPLIQPKALAFAERHRVAFAVSRANGELETEVADVSEAIWGVAEETPARLRVVLLGLGTVGRGVYESLVALSQHFELVGIVVRKPQRHVASGLSASLVTGDAKLALRPDIDLVIECWGDVEPAGSVIGAALAGGKTVVTANTAAVAAYWPEFAPFAQEPDRRLWFSAAAGGAVPMLETLAHLGEHVRELRGVINGTSNWILDSLAAGKSLDEAVRAAQMKGLSEADPRRDLSGLDTADKLSLLAQAAFGVHVPTTRIPICGIGGPLPPAETQVWRLIARAARANGEMTLAVAPERVARESFLGRTTGAENRLEIVLESGQVVRLVGQGAGRWPTTTAVLGDVREIARRRSRIAVP
jgi:homoserine dehydrogenase